MKAITKLYTVKDGVKTLTQLRALRGCEFKNIAEFRSCPMCGLVYSVSQLCTLRGGELKTITKLCALKDGGEKTITQLCALRGFE